MQVMVIKMISFIQLHKIFIINIFIALVLFWCDILFKMIGIFFIITFGFYGIYYFHPVDVMVFSLIRLLIIFVLLFFTGYFYFYLNLKINAALVFLYLFLLPSRLACLLVTILFFIENIVSEFVLVNIVQITFLIGIFVITFYLLYFDINIAIGIFKKEYSLDDLKIISSILLYYIILIYIFFNMYGAVHIYEGYDVNLFPTIKYFSVSCLFVLTLCLFVRYVLMLANRTTVKSD